MAKITIYHLTKPMTADQAAQFSADLNANFKLPPRAPLGGQSNGYFFFTTMFCATNHAQFQQETKSLTTESDTNLYLIDAQVDESEVKYPVWQLDYEANQDFFFRLFLNRASVAPIKFDDVVISASNGVLQIQDGKNFMKLREFSAKHSGFIERVATHLCEKEKAFRDKYNERLHDTLVGNANDVSVLAIKTTKCPHLISCKKIENTISPIKSSQIEKWHTRYRR